jgi:hypothetical protein
MSAAAPDKPKADRLKETVEILKKLKEVGIGEYDAGYQAVKEHMTRWLEDGRAAAYTIDFPRHGRKGELELPRRADKAASLQLRAPRATHI